MKNRRLLGLVLILLGGGVWPAQAQSPPEKAPAPPNLPILLPRLEHGQLSPERARVLLGGAIERAIDAVRLRPAGAASETCVELTSLDPPAVPDSIDVLHYDIRIDNVDETAKSFSGVTTVRLKALKDLNQLDLDLASCTVESVEIAYFPDTTFVTGSFVQQSPVPDPSPQTLTLQLAHALASGDSVNARVHYRGTTGCISVDGIPSGMVFSAVGVHTFSEPTYARHWYPCHDVPWDKATTSLFVLAPAGRVASASGISTDGGLLDDPLYNNWETTLPVSTYLNAFYLGDYIALNDSTTNGVALQYFTYPNLEENTRVDFANVPDMVAFYSTFFPYPYPRYAMSLGYFGGGMEHIMNSLIGYFFIRGDRSYESLWAHELAHQWWGDLLTVGRWRDIWLNEGFATYFDLLYTEHHYGTPAMKASIAFTDSVYQARLDLLDHPILDPPLSDVFSFTVYNKGARVLDMLRGVSRFRLMTGPPASPQAHQAAADAGDARFKSIFTEYATRHRYGNVTTADFQAVAEEKLGESLDWFFEPWLNGTAFPTWLMDWNVTPHATGSFVEVHIEQAPTDPTRFTVLLPVRYRSGATILDEVRTVGPDSVNWVVSLPPGNWSVEVDPDNWVLDKTERRPLIPHVRPLGISPNPSYSAFNFTTALEGAGPAPAQLIIHDLSGRRVRNIDLGTVLPGPVALVWDGRGDDGTRAAAGVYFARLRLGSTTATARLVLLR